MPPPERPAQEKDFTPHTPQPDELLSAKEVARLLNVTLATVYGWSKEKRVFTIRKKEKGPKPRLYFYKAEIQQIINGQHKLLELKRRD